MNKDNVNKATSEGMSRPQKKTKEEKRKEREAKDKQRNDLNVN